LTNKVKFVSGIYCKSAPFVPSRGGRIKRYQDIKAKFHDLLFLWNFAVSPPRLRSKGADLQGIPDAADLQPPRLGTKRADLQEIPDTNLPLLVNQSFLVQEQNDKLALPKLTNRQV